MESAREDGSVENYTVSEHIVGPLLSAVITIEMVLTILANSVIVLHTITHSEALKKASAILLFNLALANITVAALFMPFTVITAAVGKWLLGDGVCQFVGFVFSCYLFVIMNTLAAIAFDHWLFIVKALLYNKIMKPVVSWLFAVAIWVTATILSITPFLGLGRFDFTPEIASCFPVWTGRGYIIYGIFTSLPALLIIMITSIWTFVYTQLFIKRRYKDTNEYSSTEREVHESKVYNIKMRRIIGLFGALLLSNMILFGPQLVVSIVYLIVGEKTIPDPVYTISFVLFLLNGITNPLVQSLFRRDLKESFLKVRRKLSC